ALERSFPAAQAAAELDRMAAASTTATGPAGEQRPLWHRQYVVPFFLACVILACNQATGVNSIIAYCANMLIQAGLSDAQAHLGYVLLTLVNFVVTLAGVALVDRLGRKRLLSLGTAGIMVFLLATGLLCRQVESHRVDVPMAVQFLVDPENQTASVPFDDAAATMLGSANMTPPATLVVVYSFGDYTAASKVVRSDEPGAQLELNRESCLPANRVASFFQNPWADWAAAQVAPMQIRHAIITQVPSVAHGWLMAGCIFGFMACFAVGPGVCVWLALSELMPTRIRSNGMSIALLINQAVSTAIAAVFLPTVGQHGYAAMFFVFAACTLVYFIAATFFLPETKGKTLEEIEAGFK
ncbi:MAG TPA: MFS transporter, partial [Verrucomicrobiae bacterium]